MHPQLKRLIWLNWAERKRAMRLEMRIFAGLLYMLLLFSWLFPLKFDADSQTYLATYQVTILVRAFAFHLGLLALLCALLAVFWRWRSEALVFVPAILFCTYDAVTDYLPKSQPVANAQQGTVSILSANLLFNNRDATPLLRLIQRESPDVLVFQEYTRPMDKILSAALANSYPNSTRLPQEDAFGIAVYSRLPVLEQPVPAFDPGIDPAPQLRGVVRTLGVENKRLAIYGVHLLPVFRTYFLEEHNLQLREISRRILEEKEPAVVVGDLNFTSRNAQASVLRESGLREAWQERGWGRGSTWCALLPLRYLPGFRIDQMHMTNDVECLQIRVLEDIGSDHYPVLGVFAVH